MQTIEKKIITLYKVEISFPEFWEGFQNLVDDINADRGAVKYEAHEDMKNLAQKVLATNEGKIDCRTAEDAYHNIMNPYTADVIRYLAKSWGFTVNHFGMYYQHEDIYKCTLERTGAQM